MPPFPWKDIAPGLKQVMVGGMFAPEFTIMATQIAENRWHLAYFSEQGELFQDLKGPGFDGFTLAKCEQLVTTFARAIQC